MPYTVDRLEFEALVNEAIAALPEDLRGRLNNVVVVVEDWADPHTVREAGVGNPFALLGFYHGIPLSRRGSGYGQVTPDRISIYRMPILARSGSAGALRETVRRVVWHELAHHFGIDDDRLRDLGVY